MTTAMNKLAEAQHRTGSLLSIGLEPDTTIQESHLLQMIQATRGLACAYKLQLAHFEALGRGGWDLLYRIREAIPADTLVIADGKRNDIGSTAEKYAVALFDELKVDAVTLNPLMGRDCVQPFLERTDKLSFILALTSNPGAEDFLLQCGLYRRIVQEVREWDQSGCAGFVVGATRDVQLIRELRELAPGAPFLIPGVGAQGGDLEATVAAALRKNGLTGGNGGNGGGGSGVILHVTRGILPSGGDAGDFGDIVRRKVIELNRRIQSAREQAPTP